MPQPTNKIHFSIYDHFYSVNVNLLERKATGTSYY
jgi:hypothetical protein